ncbi:MAG: hypothetical protein IJT19_08275 [Bacteroidaceae bacterium]|nr:hypothetical protein [Bacteroidaceae bacterium]
MKLPPLFNPSNDMALAANVRQYFPPRHIQQMEDDLAGLARLWDAGPWGWSLATRQRYLRMGLAATDLPTDNWLTNLRRLSSREFAVGYYQQLATAFADEEWLLPCRARFCTSIDEVKLSISNFLAPLQSASVAYGCRLQLSIIKSPWSSSGRGNMVVDGFPLDSNTEQRIRRILHQQGGIVVEPFYTDKALDFAMEFNVEDGGTQFLGLSVFETDETGHYGGNYVESQEALRQRIGLPDNVLQRLIDYHRQALARLAYRGPVGIDMMRLSDGRVHPCVEINFRMTMGLLALIVYNKGLTTDQLLAGQPDHGFEAGIHAGRLAITFHP